MGPEADLISTQVQKTKLLKEPDTLQMSFFLSPPLLPLFFLSIILTRTMPLTSSRSSFC